MNLLQKNQFYSLPSSMTFEIQYHVDTKMQWYNLVVDRILRSIVDFSYCCYN